MEPAQLCRTLDRELAALLRGASLECPVCGEFVYHARAAVACLECGLLLADALEPAELDSLRAALPFPVQAG
jgi:predicted RNA-binding Zn-ribbon protein involved in translation (DUF1610 family)